MVPQLRPADLKNALADVPLVARTYFFEELPSTSDWAKDLIRRAGSAASLHGTLVITNHQTAGRGRMGRSWHSLRGRSLLFSLILGGDPDRSPTEYDRIVAAAAPVSVCAGIADCTPLKPRIKYPNDVLLSGRKVAGILLERSGAPGSAGFCVLGIGVNVNHAAGELPTGTRLRPTSVALEAGALVIPADLLQALLKRLQENLADPEQCSQRMAALCDTVGRLVTIRTAHGVLHGTALDYQPADGSLLVRLDSGMEVSVLSGDVEQVEHGTPAGPDGDSPGDHLCAS